MVRLVRAPWRLPRPCAGMPSDIPRSLRSVGAGYSRLLEITTSSIAPRRNAIAVRQGATIPEQYPLAVVPCASVISVATLSDQDSVHPLPLVGDVAKMLPEGFEALAEVVAVALFLAYQACYKTHAAIACAPWIEAQIELAAKSPSCPDATALLDEMETAVAVFHRAFATAYNAPTLVLLLRAWRYVLCARCELHDPSNFAEDGSVSDEQQPETFHASLAPLIDLTIARRGPANVTLVISTAHEIRQLGRCKSRDEACDFFGSGQKLFTASPSCRYFTLVSTRDLQPGDELCLEALPEGASLSPMDKIRGGM
jgi:hypothetical protein